jgi:AcrR family transcriptional regulator
MANPASKRRGRPPSGGREAIREATLELLRERGVARLTTRDVAERAGVSEASVYYHYTDKSGLLRAVFEGGLERLKAASLGGDDVVLTFGRELERFLEQALPVMTAAQSDAELRDALAAHMVANDLGPHRGVQTLGGYLAAGQRDGSVRADVDPEAAAMLFVAGCFMHVAQRQFVGHPGAPRLPSLERRVEAFETLIRPPTGPAGR